MSKCRVTVTFVAEFESDNPEVDLKQLREEGEFEPLDLINTCYNRRYHSEVDIHTEQDL